MATQISTINFAKVTKTVAAAVTPEPIMASTDANRFVSAFKVYVPTTNAGANVFIGDSTVDATWDPIAAGSKEAFNSGEGSWGKDMEFDLSKIYAAVEVDGDSVIVVYKKVIRSDI